MTPQAVSAQHFHSRTDTNAPAVIDPSMHDDEDGEYEEVLVLNDEWKDRLKNAVKKIHRKRGLRKARNNRQQEEELHEES